MSSSRSSSLDEEDIDFGNDEEDREKEEEEPEMELESELSTLVRLTFAESGETRSLVKQLVSSLLVELKINDDETELNAITYDHFHRDANHTSSATSSSSSLLLTDSPEPAAPSLADQQLVKSVNLQFKFQKAADKFFDHVNSSETVRAVNRLSNVSKHNVHLAVDDRALHLLLRSSASSLFSSNDDNQKQEEKQEQAQDLENSELSSLTDSIYILPDQDDDPDMYVINSEGSSSSLATPEEESKKSNNNIVEIVSLKPIARADLDSVLVFLENPKRTGGGEIVWHELCKRGHLLRVAYATEVAKERVIAKCFFAHYAGYELIASDDTQSVSNNVRSIRSSNKNLTCELDERTIVLRRVPLTADTQLVRLYCEYLVMQDDEYNDVDSIEASKIFASTYYVRFREVYDLNKIRSRIEKKANFFGGTTVADKNDEGGVQLLQAYNTSMIMVRLQRSSGDKEQEQDEKQKTEEEEDEEESVVVTSGRENVIEKLNTPPGHFVENLYNYDLLNVEMIKCEKSELKTITSSADDQDLDTDSEVERDEDEKDAIRICAVHSIMDHVRNKLAAWTAFAKTKLSENAYKFAKNNLFNSNNNTGNRKKEPLCLMMVIFLLVNLALISLIMLSSGSSRYPDDHHSDIDNHLMDGVVANLNDQVGRLDHLDGIVQQSRFLMDRYHHHQPLCSILNDIKKKQEQEYEEQQKQNTFNRFLCNVEEENGICVRTLPLSQQNQQQQPEKATFLKRPTYPSQTEKPKASSILLASLSLTSSSLLLKNTNNKTADYSIATSTTFPTQIPTIPFQFQLRRTFAKTKKTEKETEEEVKNSNNYNRSSNNPSSYWSYSYQDNNNNNDNDYGHNDSLTCLVALPNGLLASGSYDNTVKIWNTTATGTLQQQQQNSIENNFDNHVVIDNSFNNNGTTSWLKRSTSRSSSSSSDAEKCLMHTFHHDEPVWALTVWNAGAVTSTDIQIASASLDGTIKVWDVATGRLDNVWSSANPWAHKQAVSALVPLPDGRLASSSWDSTIKVWNQIELEFTLRDEPKAAVSHMVSLAAKKDESCLVASASDDGVVRVWNLTERKLMHRLNKLQGGHIAHVSALVALPDAHVASGSHDKTIKVWNAQEGKLDHSLEGHTSYVTALCYVGNGMLASGSLDSEIKIWNVTDGTLIYTFTKDLDLRENVDENGKYKSGPFLDNHEEDRRTRKSGKGKNWSDGRGGHRGAVVALVALNDDFDFYGAGKKDGGDAGQTIEAGKKGGQNRLRYLASGSEDKTIKVWDLTKFRLMHTLDKSKGKQSQSQGQSKGQGHDWTVNKLIVAQQASTNYKNNSFFFKNHTTSTTYLASGSWDSSVKVWDL